MAQAIRILVADDHAVVRAGLATIMEAESDIRIVGEAITGPQAIDRAIELNPDIVLMDIFMPGCSGLEAMVEIKEHLPDVRIVILTISEREEDVLQALRLGAQGYLVKSVSSSEIVKALRRTAAGEAILSPELVSVLVAELRQKPDQVKLSAREAEVLGLLEEGLTDAEIASRLFIGDSTVRTYLRRLLDKLHLKNRVEAAAYSARHHTKNRPF
jgi:DNA-binding NarL/FixJ family response regulator